GALAIVALARAHAPATVRSDVLDPAAITARSPLTRRLFAEGLTRLYHESDPVEAARLFESALREDSSCAMCAYAAARADVAVDMGLSRRLLRTAVRLSGRVSPVERLVIRQWWASLGNAPEHLALADSLAARFPDDPEVVLARGGALEVEGRFADALACYARLLREAPAVRGFTCPRCEAYAAVVRTYGAADSIDAAVRAAQEWTRSEPRSAAAWMGLASALSLADRPDAALAAVDAAEQGEGRPGVGADLLARAVLALRAERYAAADTALGVVAANGTPVERQAALWWRAIGLRYRGRPREALALVQGPLRWSEGRGLALAGYPHTLLEGQLLLESGRARDAAALFRALSVQREPEDSGMPGMIARKRAWALTHAGTALAAAGDTGAVSALADTVEREGRGSALARDHHLHDYLRGLVWAAGGEPDRARAAFRRATLSRTHGYTRPSLAEAQLLVATGRAREAIPLLTLTLRGELEASNLYVTRPELHEALARAYEAVGRPDSAGMHWRAVANAWGAGEGGYGARADTALVHLARYGPRTAPAGRARPRGGVRRP
ncbi:MAG TPA: tetratricopeptide repeat protein, partial [Gemmatirosa sp.]